MAVIDEATEVSSVSSTDTHKHLSVIETGIKSNMAAGDDSTTEDRSNMAAKNISSAVATKDQSNMAGEVKTASEQSNTGTTDNTSMAPEVQSNMAAQSEMAATPDGLGRRRIGPAKRSRIPVRQFSTAVPDELLPVVLSSAGEHGF